MLILKWEIKIRIIITTKDSGRNKELEFYALKCIEVIIEGP